MARSYKKTPYYTDGSCGSTKNTKRIANRIVRRRNKRIMQGYLQEDPRYLNELTLDGKHYKKYFCSYDIHDWINYWSMQDAIHSYHTKYWYNWKTNEWERLYSEYKDEEEFIKKYWEKYHKRK